MVQVLPPLNGTEVVVITPNILNAEIFQAAGVSVTTTQDIADLAAGEGLTSQVIVESGTSYTAPTTKMFVGWNSATTGNKTLTIPASTGGLSIFVVSDLIGSAYLYPITVSPVTGTVVGPNQVYTNLGSITLLDTAAGWVSI